jgi:hypothetical protein
VITNKISALVHPKLQFRGFHNHVSHITDLLEKAENQHFQNLLSLDVDDVPLHDAITALQSLILYLITYLFSTDPTVQISAESHLHLLPDWASKLWTTAAHRIPANLSPHQSWLLGETTRRTLDQSWCLFMSLGGWWARDGILRVIGSWSWSGWGIMGSRQGMGLITVRLKSRM